MVGWELPPYNSGGLGTACLGMTEELSPLGVDIDFVLPNQPGLSPYKHMRVINAADFKIDLEHITLQQGKTALSLGKNDPRLQHFLAYGSALVQNPDGSYRVLYSGQEETAFAMLEQSVNYAQQAAQIAQQTSYDLIHCHDWMTYESGIAARDAAASHGQHIPLIAHVHATEIDRCGNHGNPLIIEKEKQGLQAADRVIAVSDYTKKMIHQHYQVPLSRISVVHNGVPAQHSPKKFTPHPLHKDYKLVLFMGRITAQKGPEYFVKLAKRVTDRDPKVKFLMVGSGDMEQQCISLGASLGLTGKLLFSPFLRGPAVDQAYQMADLFVMPSVSEPFGIVALEAIQNGTPVLVSKQSGVAEVSGNFLRVNFWDEEKMASAVLTALHSPKKLQRMRQIGYREIPRLTWQHSAERLQEIYQEILSAWPPGVRLPAHA